MNIKTGIVLICMVAFFGCKQQEMITGRIDGLTNDTLFIARSALIFPLYDQKNIQDTVIISPKGKFVYNPEIQKPSVIRITPAQSQLKNKKFNAILPNPSFTAEMLVLPGEKMSIKGTCKAGFLDYTVSGTGTRFNEIYSNVRKNWRNAETDLYNISQQLIMSTETVGKELSDKYMARLAKIYRLKTDFVKTHLDNPVSGYILIGNDMDYFKRVDLINQLDTNVMLPELKSVLNVVLKESKRVKLMLERQGKIVPGIVASDFTLMNDKNESVTLSNLRGKYVVLEFWGRGSDEWCIKGIPEMEKAYQQYKDKIVFINIACNYTDEEWSKTLADHPMTWMQLMNSTKDLKNDAAANYCAIAFPTKIIINPEGVIEFVFSGEEKTFYERLREIYKGL